MATSTSTATTATTTTTLLFLALLLISSSGNAFIADHHIDNHLLKKCNFDRIYQLGDSISDTGNLIRESPIGAATRYSRLPYGQTYFRNATGRCSNGLLMIDYIALNAGLPFLNPYKKSDANFSHGANFAVAGSAALSTQFLASKNISSGSTNSSLNVQLDWMFTHFNSVCSIDRDCGEKLKNSLFLVGEIGGNDYNYAFLQGQTIKKVKKLVPNVVQAIMAAVRKVIKYGASRVVVPGNFPIGCFPIYLTLFQTNNSKAYDDHQCLKDMNNFSIYHNKYLQIAIKELKRENPNIAIVYGDYYNAFQWLFHRAKYLGFDSNSVQKACCGTGGDYNFNAINMCDSNIPVCPDPRRYISWDGLHQTQEAYQIMANWLIFNIFPKLQCIS